MKSLTIDSIDIKGIGPIMDLHLDFDPHFNIICGANGVGKTTILDCISQSFVFKPSVRCNAAMSEGKWKTAYCFDGVKKLGDERSTKIKYLCEESPHRTFYNQSESLLVYKVNRLLQYVNVESISRDPSFDSSALDKFIMAGADHKQIKHWFVNRYVWQPHEGGLNEVAKCNLEIAQKCVGYVNSEFEFSRVSHESNDVLIRTPFGEIELEQLSSGYIAMLIVLLGIIKDIEYRYKDSQNGPLVKVEEFSGVVVIDEMDVHLHPTMQAQMYLALKKLLPNAQVITSTHSPHVIQVAKPSEIIPLVRKDGNVYVNPLVNREYGCQGWTVEEILEDVMNMQETRTPEYHQAMNDFNDGLRADDGAKVRVAYEKLNLMLHPNNVLRQVLEIKKIGVGNDQD